MDQIRAMGVRSSVVLEAMRMVPRDEFVPSDLKSQAWANRPLPIGQGQTISQPYTVAFMLELAGVGRDDQVLEIGGGCGYAAACAGWIVGTDGRVVAVEILEELALRASSILAKLGYGHVSVVSGDGKEGYQSGAPYDRIVVSATAPEIPQALLDQMAIGGTLVMPVKKGASSVMTRVLRTKAGYKESTFGMFDFVNLI